MSSHRLALCANGSPGRLLTRKTYKPVIKTPAEPEQNRTEQQRDNYPGYSDEPPKPRPLFVLRQCFRHAPCLESGKASALSHGVSQHASMLPPRVRRVCRLIEQATLASSC